MEGDRDVGHADHTPADHHDDHRNNGFSGTAEDSGGTVGKGQEEIYRMICEKCEKTNFVPPSR